MYLGESDAGKRRTPLAAVGDLRFIGALVVLVANDWWWKASYGSWLTGKLSDVAGLVVLPVVVATIGHLVSNKPVSDRLCAATWFALGAWFTFMKTTAIGANLTETLIESIGVPSTILVDPTDLIGLAGLIVAWRIVSAPRAVHIESKGALSFVLFAALVACTATSSAGYDGSLDLAINANGEVVEPNWLSAEEQETLTGIGLETEACTSDDQVCLRLDGDTVERSVNGGAFEAVWAFDTTAPPSINKLQRGHPESHRGVFDVIAGPDDRMHVMVGASRPIVMSADGSWDIDSSYYRPIAGQLAAFLFFAFAALILATGRLDMPAERTGLAFAGAGVPLGIWQLLSVDSGEGGVFDGLAPVLFVAALFLISFGVAVATLLVNVFDYERTRIKWLSLVATAFPIVMLFVGGRLLRDSATWLALCAILGLGMWLAWHKGKITSHAVRQFLGAFGAAIAVLAVMALPQLWWQSAVTARFSVAFPLSLILGVVALGAVWRFRPALAGVQR